MMLSFHWLYLTIPGAQGELRFVELLSASLFVLYIQLWYILGVLDFSGL